MRLTGFLLPLALLAAPTLARQTIGAFGQWAAFCDAPRACFAIAEPAERGGGAFLRVALRGRDPQVLVRAGRPMRDASLRVGEAKFALLITGEDALADSTTSRRIVAAIRAGETLVMSGTTTKGGRFRQHYALTGAPSAIDAAAVAAVR